MADKRVYKSDEDIAKEFANFTISDKEFKITSKPDSDRVLGQIVINFPETDESVGGGAEPGGKEIIDYWSYDRTDGSWGFDHWYPEQTSNKIKEYILNKIIPDRKLNSKEAKVLGGPEISIEDAIKQGLITENDTYTDKALNEALKNWKEYNKNILFGENAWRKDDNAFPTFEAAVKAEKRNYDWLSANKEYAVTSYFLPNIQARPEEEEQTSNLVKEEVNVGKLSSEQVDKLDLKLDNFTMNISSNGGEVEYQLTTNDKGETIIKWEGNAAYWTHFNELKEAKVNKKAEGQKTYQEGDRIKDPGRPNLGEGVVVSANTENPERMQISVQWQGGYAGGVPIRELLISSFHKKTWDRLEKVENVNKKVANDGLTEGEFVSVISGTHVGCKGVIEYVETIDICRGKEDELNVEYYGIKVLNKKLGDEGFEPDLSDEAENGKEYGIISCPIEQLKVIDESDVTSDKEATKKDSTKPLSIWLKENPIDVKDPEYPMVKYTMPGSNEVVEGLVTKIVPGSNKATIICDIDSKEIEVPIGELEVIMFNDGPAMESDYNRKSASHYFVMRLQQNYDTLEEFKSYDETYGLSKRLGFDTPEAAWEFNPRIQVGADPNDFKIVEPKSANLNVSAELDLTIIPSNVSNLQVERVSKQIIEKLNLFAKTDIGLKVKAEVESVISNFEAAENLLELNAALDTLYDFADSKRILVKTSSNHKEKYDVGDKAIINDTVCVVKSSSEDGGFTYWAYIGEIDDKDEYAELEDLGYGEAGDKIKGHRV